VNLFEHLLLATREGLAEIHRDRDDALTFEVRYGGSPDLDAYLARLDEEQAQHALMVDALTALARTRHPILLQDVRPSRMLKVGLRAVVPARTGTDW
jgi:hypothetical protein